MVRSPPQYPRVSVQVYLESTCITGNTLWAEYWYGTLNPSAAGNHNTMESDWKGNLSAARLHSYGGRDHRWDQRSIVS